MRPPLGHKCKGKRAQFALCGLTLSNVRCGCRVSGTASGVLRVGLYRRGLVKGVVEPLWHFHPKCPDYPKSNYISDC